ncbi:MAG: hypothetical protein EON61_02435 [Alphaproteobacteria bacterium]|nr:MAG: hypothetical protein EON61_02435 [Alphaproteobacteria bacterium]
MALTAAAEARSEGTIGMALAMETMVNRLSAGHYGGQSMFAVVTAPFAYAVFNNDSHVRDRLLSLVKSRQSDGSEIGEYALAVLPIAEAVLRGWRTGLLPSHNDSCRHYKTRETESADPTQRSNKGYSGWYPIKQDTWCGCPQHRFYPEASAHRRHRSVGCDAHSHGSPLVARRAWFSRCASIIPRTRIHNCDQRMGSTL